MIFGWLTDAIAAQSRSELDAVGNLLSFTDPEGNQTTYLYDDLDRLTTETQVVPAGPDRIRTYEDYTPTGVAQTITDRNGASCTKSLPTPDRPTSKPDRTGMQARSGCHEVDGMA